MRQVILREYESYTKEALLSKFEVDNHGLKNIIKKLAKKNIIKKDCDKYKFVFVGMCVIDDITLFINPKYTYDDYDSKKVLKLLEEYSNREALNIEEEEFLSFDSENIRGNVLGIIKYILDDFFYSGLYIKKEKNITLNGSGKIDWNKTIEENKVIFNSNNEPIYYELKTLKNDIDYNAEITRIHKYIIDKCFETLRELGLENVFEYDFEGFDLIENFDSEFMIFVINQELNTQFEDKKISLLKAMINFIEQKESNSEDQSISLYGTKYFHIVWEKINSYLFKNQYESLSKHIPITSWKSSSGDWIDSDKNKIKPDILRKYKNDLMIIDAKYYNIKLNDNSVSGNPGSYDVIKQFTYEMAFNNKKDELNINNIVNVLLYPKCIEEHYKCFGLVKLDIFNFKPIKNIYISDKFVYDRYIDNKPFNNGEIEDFIKYLIILGSRKWLKKEKQQKYYKIKKWM